MRGKTFEENSKYRWIVYDDGSVYRVSKKIGGRNAKLKSYEDDNGNMRVMFNKRFRFLARVVAKAFIPEFDWRDKIEYADGDKSNCSLGNIRLRRLNFRSDVRGGNNGKGSKPKAVIVTYPDGREVEYWSMSQCASVLNVSFSALDRYVKGNFTERHSLYGSGIKIKFK